MYSVAGYSSFALSVRAIRRDRQQAEAFAAVLAKLLTSNNYLLTMVTWQSNLDRISSQLQLSYHLFYAALPPRLGKMGSIPKFECLHLKQSPALPGDFKKKGHFGHFHNIE